MLPEAQTVQPVQPWPLHWPYCEAAHVEVAVAELLVVLLEAPVDVVDMVELTRVELEAGTVALEAEDEELLPPDDPSNG